MPRSCQDRLYTAWIVPKYYCQDVDNHRLERIAITNLGGGFVENSVSEYQKLTASTRTKLVIQFMRLFLFVPYSYRPTCYPVVIVPDERSHDELADATSSENTSPGPSMTC
jgi:hypothetical protein